MSKLLRVSTPPNWYCEYNHPKGTTCPSCADKVVMTGLFPDGMTVRVIAVARRHIPMMIREAKVHGGTVIGYGRPKNKHCPPTN